MICWKIANFVREVGLQDTLCQTSVDFINSISSVKAPCVQKTTGGELYAARSRHFATRLKLVSIKTFARIVGIYVARLFPKSRVACNSNQ